jgi:hypothetical protein
MNRESFFPLGRFLSRHELHIQPWQVVILCGRGSGHSVTDQNDEEGARPTCWRRNCSNDQSVMA